MRSKYETPKHPFPFHFLCMHGQEKSHKRVKPGNGQPGDRAHWTLSSDPLTLNVQLPGLSRSSSRLRRKVLGVLHGVPELVWISGGSCSCEMRLKTSSRSKIMSQRVLKRKVMSRLSLKF